MNPILVGSFLLLLLTLGFSFYFVWRKRRKALLLLEIRSSWGRRKDSAFRFDFDKIGLYHRLKRKDEAPFLSDKVWADLNLNEVFALLDSTRSKVGQQFLYHLLRCPVFQKEPLLQFDEVVTHFEDPESRERTQLDLHRLSDKDAMYLPNLFLDELPAESSYRFVFPLLSLTALGCIIVTFFNSGFLLLLFPIAITNVFVSLHYRREIRQSVQPLRLLNVLIATARRISAYEEDSLAKQTSKLRDSLKQVSKLARTTSWLIFEGEQLGDIFKILYDYLNMFFLLDVNAFVFSLEELRNNQVSVERIFETVGLLDAAISVASFRASCGHYTLPQFLPAQKRGSFSDLYHPLVDDPVPNDLSIDDRGILLTGSNMSGKSTFIRTVGVNAVLAQTIYTCLATEYRAPFLEIKTSIGRDDDLLEGKSYYLAEVESVLELIESTRSPRQHLFLIDELFRGTNTVERVAAAKAILRYLNSRDDLVLVSTHDIELVELLGDGFECHHFREVIENQEMNFDYKLQSGISSTRNAIAILEMFGYPEDVVAEALQIVEQLEERKSGFATNTKR